MVARDVVLLVAKDAILWFLGTLFLVALFYGC